MRYYINIILSRNCFANYSSGKALNMGIKYKVNEDFFKIWTKNSAYILGFIFADGHLEDAAYIRGKYLRITSTDFSIIKRIKETLNSTHKVVVIPASDNRKEKYLLRIGSHKIYYDLESLSLHPRKSLTMRFPQIPIEFLSDFVRGYFDGDGTITFESMKNKPFNRVKIIFTSGSKDFLSALSGALEKYCVGRLAKIYNSRRSYQLLYTSKEALMVLNFIYDGLNEKEILYLDRKYNKYKQLVLNPSEVRCDNLFDKNSKVWTYGTKKATYPRGLREESAKLRFSGSNPLVASNFALV